MEKIIAQMMLAALDKNWLQVRALHGHLGSFLDGGGEALTPEEIDLHNRGKRIAAIKSIRDRTGLTLIASKKIYDAWRDRDLR